MKRRIFEKDDAFALRGWCILLIIVHHIVLFFSEKYGVVLPRWGVEIRDLGYAVVGTFFVLSGYGVYHSVMKNKPLSLQYWSRRLLKLYIPFVFVVLVISVLKHFLTHFEMNELWHSLITLSLPSEELWFLRTIFWFHVGAYALLGYMRKPTWGLAIISVLTVVWMLVADYYLGRFSNWWTSLWCFPIGTWIAAYRDKIEKLDRPITWLCIGALLLCSYAFTLFSRTHYCPNELTYYLIPWVRNIVAATFALSFIKFVPMLGTKSKVLNYCGKNSLMLYMSHVGLLLIITPKSMWIFALLIVVIAFAITAVYDLLDRRWISHWLNSHTPKTGSI